MSMNLCYFETKVETTKDLCRHCRHEQGDDCCYGCRLCEMLCMCENNKTYNHSLVVVSLPEAKIPTESVYIISIYTSIQEISIWDIDSNIPILTFSIYSSMDDELSMRSLLVDNNLFF